MTTTLYTDKGGLILTKDELGDWVSKKRMWDANNECGIRHLKNRCLTLPRRHIELRCLREHYMSEGSNLVCAK